MKFAETDLNKINLADDRFRISYFFDLAKLKRSITESGLLSPVVVTPRDQSLVIVSGWKRALACLDLLLPTISCFILEELDDLKAFQLGFLENSATRDFDILESAIVLKKLKTFGVDEQTLLNTYLPLFGIPQTLAYLDSFLATAEFDTETKEFIHTGKVSYSVIQRLTQLKKEERIALLPYLRLLGLNKQKELLEFLLEISKRDNISILDILTSSSLTNVIHSTTLSPLQIADKIRLLLRERRYPSYSAQKVAFESSLKKMEWPEDVVIEHSPFFEGEDLTIRFTFKDKTELKTKVQKLQDMADDYGLDEILKLISDD